MSSIEENSLALRARLSQLDADQLEELVRKHNALYWDQHAPEIDDATFDVAVEALKVARPSSPVLEELGERRPPASPFGDVVHERPMLSLDKCYDDETLLKWADGIKGGFLMTPKIDGVACSLRYDARGRLTQAATRGDGKVGDDITGSVRRVPDIPQTLAGLEAPLEVRGEIYLRLSRFKEKFQATKANPRNLAAGGIKSKDPEKKEYTGAAYDLSFFAYDLLADDVASERAKLGRLAALGFPVLPYRHFDDKAALPEGFRAFIEICKDLDTETDGVVIKADSVAEQQRLGITAHHPRGAIAYKFQGESALSTIKKIEWGAARSGALTPVAVIDPPVFISGVKVTRVSLHNAGYAVKLGVGEGAQVEVVRRGGVIPHVERVLRAPAKLIELPTQRAVEGGHTGLHWDGDFLLLDEPERSPEVLVDRVRHFADAIDAKGFGEEVLKKMFDKGLVRWPADLYHLDVAALAALGRMGEKSAQNLRAAIEGKRKLTLPVFLEALGLERVGVTVADKLASTFHTLPAVRAATEEQLADIDGIGPEIASAVVRGLKESAPLIDALLKEIELVEAERPSDTSHPLYGKSVVFTGALAHMDRKSAQQRVQAVGGKTPSGVSAELDYLVIGDEGSALTGSGERSSKHKSADKLIAKGAKLVIISESDFMKLLDPKTTA